MTDDTFDRIGLTIAAVSAVIIGALIVFMVVWAFVTEPLTTGVVLLCFAVLAKIAWNVVGRFQ